MRKVLMTIGIVGVGLLLAPATALSAGNAQSGATVGDCISDGVYGNEPNTIDPEVKGVGPAELEPGTKAHRIVPSQSPGPKKTEEDGTVVPGSSVGDFHQEFGGGTVPAACREATS
jgi:hypothetical protein